MTHFSNYRKLPSRMFFGWLTLSLLIGCEEPAEVGEPTATWIVSNGFAIDLEYSEDEMFEFDIAQYLQHIAPHLYPYAEMISQSAAETRISPRLLIALMEHQSDALENPHFHDARPLGSLSLAIGFFEQLRDVSGRLRAALTIEYALGEMSAPQIAAAKVLPDEVLEQFGGVYQRLFPGVVSRRKIVTMSSVLDFEIQLPHPIAKKWAFGGPDDDDGESSTLSSLDSVTGSEDRGQLVNHNVVAAAPGRVKVHSSCYVDIVHEEGWSTAYYHLNKIMVKTGDMVVPNQPIAEKVNNRKQAICMGVGATGPDVHWTLRQHGREVRFSEPLLAGWTVHPEKFDDDDRM